MIEAEDHLWLLFFFGADLVFFGSAASVRDKPVPVSLAVVAVPSTYPHAWRTSKYFCGIVQNVELRDALRACISHSVELASSFGNCSGM